MAVKKSKKNSHFLIYTGMSYLKTMFLQQLKKGVSFVHGRYTKEVSFLPKIVYRRGRGSSSGQGL